MKSKVWMAAVVGLFGTAAVGAAEGRIPVFGATQINQPGHYIVTRDISTAGPSPVITMGAIGCTPFSGVTLDLNGFTLAKSGSANVILINTACISRGVTIRNGRIIGGGVGSSFGSGIASTNQVGLDLRLENLEIGNSPSHGVNILAAHAVHVLNSYIHDAGISGIVVTAGVSPFHGTFIGNTIETVRWDALRLDGMQGGHVKGNIITNFGLDPGEFTGINLSSTSAIGDLVGGNLVEGNTISSLTGGTDDTGIFINGSPGLACSHNRVLDNIVRNNYFGASILSDENRIEGNVLSRNLIGLWVGRDDPMGARNHIEGNSIQGNTQCGLRFGNGVAHTYRNNIGGGNGFSGSICLGFPGNLDLGGNSGL